MAPARENDEKAFNCNSPDLIAGLGGTKPLPKGAAARTDNCAPIGRTEDGKLVYSMKCENLPVPPPASPQAETREAPAPEPEVQRGGIFGWSYERKRPGE